MLSRPWRATCTTEGGASAIACRGKATDVANKAGETATQADKHAINAGGQGAPLQSGQWSQGSEAATWACVGT